MAKASLLSKRIPDGFNEEIKIYLKKATARSPDRVLIFDFSNYLQTGILTKEDLESLSFALLSVANGVRQTKLKDNYVYLMPFEGVRISGVLDKTMKSISEYLKSSGNTATPPANANPIRDMLFDNVRFGLSQLATYYVLPKTGIIIYENSYVRNCFSFFVSEDRMGYDANARTFNNWLTNYVKLTTRLIKDTYINAYGNRVDSFRYDFFFGEESDPTVPTTPPSLDKQEAIFRRIDDKLVEDWDFPDFSTQAPVVSQTTPDVVGDDVTSTVFDSVYEAELDVTKKEIQQLVTMRSLVSPIDFETKLIFNQKIDAAQKKINELNFKIIEGKLQDDDIFDDLFEQSFTPIRNTYSEIYASSGTSENPQSTNFFTPDGMPSKLSDAVNMMIRSPQFNEWFGNWQLAYNYRDTPDEISCSKVVTKDYEPLLVWHGTGTQFSYFRFDSFPAAYFAVTKAYSEWFADLHGGGEGYTIPFFLNIRNPLDLTRFKTTKIKPKEFFDYMYLMTGMDMKELEVNPLFMDSSAPPMETWVYLRNNASMLKKLADSHVFDGIHFYETNPSVTEGQAAHVTEAFIIFNPNQCKIADPDRGKYLFGSLKSFLLEKGGKI